MFAWIDKYVFACKHGLLYVLLNNHVGQGQLIMASKKIECKRCKGSKIDPKYLGKCMLCCGRGYQVVHVREG